MYLVTVSFPFAAKTAAAIVPMSCLRVLRMKLSLSCFCRRRVLFQKLYALERDGLRGGSNVAPYRGRRGYFPQRKPKALDGKPSVIADSAQGCEHVVPLHMPGTGDAAIIL